jgi:hypothetical protein
VQRAPRLFATSSKLNSTARALTYAVRRGGPATFNAGLTPTCSCHLWNARSHADRRGNGCPSAPGMQHSGAADGPVNATVSQIHAGCKQTSSSVAAVDETAGAGAIQQRLDPADRTGTDGLAECSAAAFVWRGLCRSPLLSRASSGADRAARAGLATCAFAQLRARRAGTGCGHQCPVASAFVPIEARFSLADRAIAAARSTGLPAVQDPGRA